MRNISTKQILFTALISTLIGVSCATALQRNQKKEEAAAVPISISNPSVASEEQNNVEIYRAMSPGVVHITSTVAVQSFFGVYPQQGTGSGSIIDKEGHILTNYHVVRDARRLDVTLADKSAYRATLVGADPDNDIAVIKIDIPADKLNIIPMGNSAELEIGQKVLAIGNPFGLDRTLTTGVISGLDRPLQAEDGKVIEKVIQTDASINPGNSGGPLLNKFGQLIGINTAIFSPSGGSVGIGFAVPIDTAKKILPELIELGKVRKGYLGVVTAPLTPNISQEYGISAKQGAIVINVQPGSPAADAGIKGLQNSDQIGDIIVSIEGQSVKDPGDLARFVGSRKPGDKIKLGVLRQGAEQQIEVALADRPGEVPVRKKPGILDWLR